MQATDTTRPFSTTQRPAHHQPLLRNKVQTTLQHDLTLLQAQSLLTQALDELQRVPIDDADAQQADRFHEAFVQILHAAHLLHPTVEQAVQEHMTHALRVHFADHDHIAHALVSSWTSVPPHKPIALVVDLIDILASDAAPLPFWTSHLLQMLPPAAALTTVPGTAAAVAMATEAVPIIAWCSLPIDIARASRSMSAACTGLPLDDT